MPLRGRTYKGDFGVVSLIGHTDNSYLFNLVNFAPFREMSAMSPLASNTNPIKVFKIGEFLKKGSGA